MVKVVYPIQDYRDAVQRVFAQMTDDDVRLILGLRITDQVMEDHDRSLIFDLVMGDGIGSLVGDELREQALDNFVQEGDEANLYGARGWNMLVSMMEDTFPALSKAFDLHYLRRTEN